MSWVIAFKVSIDSLSKRGLVKNSDRRIYPLYLIITSPKHLPKVHKSKEKKDDESQFKTKALSKLQEPDANKNGPQYSFWPVLKIFKGQNGLAVKDTMDDIAHGEKSLVQRRDAIKVPFLGIRLLSGDKEKQSDLSGLESPSSTLRTPKSQWNWPGRYM